jgi:hypothetical protein
MLSRFKAEVPFYIKRQQNQLSFVSDPLFKADKTNAIDQDHVNFNAVPDFMILTTVQCTHLYYHCTQNCILWVVDFQQMAYTRLMWKYRCWTSCASIIIARVESKILHQSLQWLQLNNFIGSLHDHPTRRSSPCSPNKYNVEWGTSFTMKWLAMLQFIRTGPLMQPWSPLMTPSSSATNKAKPLQALPCSRTTQVLPCSNTRCCTKLHGFRGAMKRYPVQIV